MKALYELKENCKAELRVTVDGDEWKKANEKAFKKVANNVQLKGFRKGKAPLDLVRKSVSQREIWMEAIYRHSCSFFIRIVKRFASI